MWDRYRWQLEQRDWGVGNLGVWSLFLCAGRLRCIPPRLKDGRTAPWPRSCRYTHWGAASRRCSRGDHHGSLQPLIQVNQRSSWLRAFFTLWSPVSWTTPSCILLLLCFWREPFEAMPCSLNASIPSLTVQIPSPAFCWSYLICVGSQGIYRGCHCRCWAGGARDSCNVS